MNPNDSPTSPSGIRPDARITEVAWLVGLGYSDAERLIELLTPPPTPHIARQQLCLACAGYPEFGHRCP